jgi:ABC-2 type transport system ATP-binding protein
VLSITSEDPRRLRDELQHADGISSLLLTGDGVHVVVDDAARRTQEFQSRLRSANVPFDGIVQVTPTIEDLFVDAVTSRAATPST